MPHLLMLLAWALSMPPCRHACGHTHIYSMYKQLIASGVAHITVVGRGDKDGYAMWHANGYAPHTVDMFMCVCVRESESVAVAYEVCGMHCLQQ